jgi:RNA polymerase sigma-70 factor (ECF subfamily)
VPRETEVEESRADPRQEARSGAPEPAHAAGTATAAPDSRAPWSRQASPDPRKADERVEQAIRNLQERTDTDQSFRAVYDAYFNGVRRFFERKGVPPGERPDLIQITFMRIFKGVEGLKSTASFEAFLRTTAHRVFLKWLEKTNSNRETLGGRTRVAPDDQEILDYLVSDEPWPIPLNRPASPGHDLQHKDLVGRVAQAIEEMPPAMSRIAKLRFIHGLTNKEITRALHKTPGDVGYQLHQARKRLAGMLKADGDSSDTSI